MADRFSCARAARARGEQRYATASTVRRWILVEQAGPWGHDAVFESRLPAAVAAELSALADDLNARLLLVRQPWHATDASRACFVARTDADASWVERFDVEDPAELVDLDLEPLRAGRRPGGQPVDRPLHLVCTHGRHDACCAEFGRPLLAALVGRVRGQVWECSHIGGDRFAANLVCFPHGLYFGHVEPADGARVAARYEDGEIDLAHYRGRCAYAFTTQAGEFFIRETLGLTAVDALRFASRERLAEDVFRVVFAGPEDRHYRADVRVRRQPEPSFLSCQAPEPASAKCYDLLDVRPLT